MRDAILSGYPCAVIRPAQYDEEWSAIQMEGSSSEAVLALMTLEARDNQRISQSMFKRITSGSPEGSAEAELDFALETSIFSLSEQSFSSGMRARCDQWLDARRFR
jgi:hypothetical protein